jgi:nicotinamidase-related amidase
MVRPGALLARHLWGRQEPWSVSVRPASGWLDYDLLVQEILFMPLVETALLVIDVQESFRHRPYWTDADLPLFLEHLEMLIDGSKSRNVPVVQIFHVEDSGPFSLASGHVVTLKELSFEPDAVFYKRSHSALVGSGLDVWLVRNGIRRVIVSGIRTEQCCETTTRHASDSGYSVDYVTNATLTFSMTDRNGRTWSPNEIKERTELVLDGRFARIVSVKEALVHGTGQLVG